MGRLIISKVKTSENGPSWSGWVSPKTFLPLSKEEKLKVLVDMAVWKPPCRKGPNKVKLSKFKSDT